MSIELFEDRKPRDFAFTGDDYKELVNAVTDDFAPSSNETAIPRDADALIIADKENKFVFYAVANPDTINTDKYAVVIKLNKVVVGSKCFFKTTIDEIKKAIEEFKKIFVAETRGKIQEIKKASHPRRTNVDAGEERNVPAEVWQERYDQAVSDPLGINRKSKEHRAVFGIHSITGETTPVCENAEAGAQYVGDPGKDTASSFIYKCCSGNADTYFGYFWAYASPEDIKYCLDQAIKREEKEKLKSESEQAIDSQTDFEKGNFINNFTN